MITDNYRYALVAVYFVSAGLGMAAAYGGIELGLVISESNNWWEMRRSEFLKWSIDSIRLIRDRSENYKKEYQVSEEGRTTIYMKKWH